MADDKKRDKKIDPDEVIVTIGQKQITGWSEAEIRCGIDIMPWLGQLAVTVSRRRGDEPRAHPLLRQEDGCFPQTRG